MIHVSQGLHSTLIVGRFFFFFIVISFSCKTEFFGLNQQVSGLFFFFLAELFFLKKFLQDKKIFTISVFSAPKYLIVYGITETLECIVGKIFLKHILNTHQDGYYQNLKIEKSKCWRGFEETATHVLCLREYKIVQPLQKRVWRLLTG